MGKRSAYTFGYLPKMTKISSCSKSCHISPKAFILLLFRKKLVLTH